MRELLADNVAVRRHFEEVHGALGFQVVSVSSRPRVREVTTLPSWITCFLTFLAVSTTDAVTRDRLAYAILIVREAMRHGGQGWLEYDRLFHQQACLNLGLPWNVIHPGLQATTILGRWDQVPHAPYVGNVIMSPPSVPWPNSSLKLFRVVILLGVAQGWVGFVHHGMMEPVLILGHAHTAMCA